MVGLAGILGVVVGSVAGWKGATWSGIALSGASGPALLASAYLTTGGGVGGNSEDARPYLAAMFSLGAGLLASMAVASATIPHRPPPRPAKPFRRPTRPRRPRRSRHRDRGGVGSVGHHLVRGTGSARPRIVLRGAFVPARAGVATPVDLPAHALSVERGTPAARPEPASRPDLYRHAEAGSGVVLRSHRTKHRTSACTTSAHPPRPSSYGATAYQALAIGWRPARPLGSWMALSSSPLSVASVIEDAPTTTAFVGSVCVGFASSTPGPAGLQRAVDQRPDDPARRRRPDSAPDDQEQRFRSSPTSSAARRRPGGGSVVDLARFRERFGGDVGFVPPVRRPHRPHRPVRPRVSRRTGPPRRPRRLVRTRCRAP